MEVLIENIRHSDGDEVTCPECKKTFKVSSKTSKSKTVKKGMHHGSEHYYQKCPHCGKPTEEDVAKLM